MSDAAPLIDPGWLPAELRDQAPLVAERLDPAAHGDLPRWRAALAALPALQAQRVSYGDCVTARGGASGGAAGADDLARLRSALMELAPWRKGPFSLFGVDIDTEWRSDWKWQRVLPHLKPLQDQRVLDIGCGNGYFGWRMLEAGARQVVGVDPSPLFCVQHLAVSRYLGGGGRNLVLPLRFEELAPATFDSVFSMGVIYHRREPEAHARALFERTRPGGQVVLESLVVEQQKPLVPEGRYARMRNVWIVPTPALMVTWLEQAGFRSVRVVDVTRTTVEEQRPTAWMPFQSLAHALSPENPTRTVEGHPAPVRAIVAGVRPV